MPRRVLGSVALLSFLAAGCFVPADAKPTVGLGATFATRFVHRGMTLVDKPVLQPKMTAALPTNIDSQLQFTVEGNIDLHNSTGSAWFPDGHAGRFTQIEMVASDTRQITDGVSLTTGIHSYNLPNGLEFENGERGGTTEVFWLVSAEVLEANPYFALHYDFDEVRGSYYRAGIAEGIPIADKWSIDLDGSVGYVSEAQASWMYGIEESGVADVRGEVVLKYQYDDRTELRAGAHASLIWDDVIDDWFTQLQIDDDPIWFTVGVAWIF